MAATSALCGMPWGQAMAHQWHHAACCDYSLTWMQAQCALCTSECFHSYKGETRALDLEKAMAKSQVVDYSQARLLQRGKDGVCRLRQPRPNGWAGREKGPWVRPRGQSQPFTHGPGWLQGTRRQGKWVSQ